MLQSRSILGFDALKFCFPQNDLIAFCLNTFTLID